MEFQVTYRDGSIETVEYDKIDVPEINRKDVSKFFYGDVGVDIDAGVFHFGDKKLAFAFNGEDTKFILFRRGQISIKPGVGTTDSTLSIVFGLRNTVDTGDGHMRNHIQLVWCYPDGISIGGNK